MDTKERSAVNMNLIDLLDDGHAPTVEMYRQHLDALKLNRDEQELFHAALSKGGFLHDMVSSAIWDRDRHKAHVLIRSYDYCQTVMEHMVINDAKPAKTVRELYSRIVLSSSVRCGSKERLPEDQYQRISSQLNARYLILALTLYSGPNIVSELDGLEMVYLPLMKNEDSVKKALPTILDFWQTSKTPHWEHRPGIHEVLDIASLLEEHPGAGDYVVTFARERLCYDGQLIREQLNNSSALASGSL